MSVLVLSPGSTEKQLQRLPALTAVASELKESIQVACDPSQTKVWGLSPQVEKVIPFEFSSNPSLADWANLLGIIREQDFQLCLNFAKGTSVNLMLAISRIPTRVAMEGFTRTKDIAIKDDWSAQALGSYLQPIGLTINANKFRLSVPKSLIKKVMDPHPKGNQKLLLFALEHSADNQVNLKTRDALHNEITTSFPNIQTFFPNRSTDLDVRAAEVAYADVVISYCPVVQMLAVFNHKELIALNSKEKALPQRDNILQIGSINSGLHEINQQEILSALGQILDS